jgi:hypothetical protein
MSHFIQIIYDGKEKSFDYIEIGNDKARVFLEEELKFTGWVDWIEIIDGEQEFYLREHFVNGVCHNENGPAYYTKNYTIELWSLHYSLNNIYMSESQWKEKIRLIDYNKDFENIIK